jgi:putative chitinase
MSFDRKIFFDAVRPEPFPDHLTQQQVDGMEAILTCWEGQTAMTDLRWLAYMLATTFHETAQKMWPIEEYGKGSGYEYGKKDPETGQAYYGRGFVQLTWRDNYHYATEALGLTGEDDMEWHADRALDLEIASDVMFRGMGEGWFTDKKLEDYFNSTTDDPVNARAIINNDVSKNGGLVAGYHNKFLDALEAAYTEELPPPPMPLPDKQVLVALTVPEGVEVTVTVNGTHLQTWKTFNPTEGE